MALKDTNFIENVQEINECQSGFTRLEAIFTIALLGVLLYK